MAGVSPTLEGFRAAFRRPSLTLGEITWRWIVGATAVVLFFFGLFEYLNTLPVTNGELLFLRTRQPYLVAQAILHILRGSLNRAVLSLMTAALSLVLLWIIVASLGRIATAGVMLDYFRDRFARNFSGSSKEDGGRKEVSNAPTMPLGALMRLNFLRVAVAMAAFIGFAGAALLTGLVSSDSKAQPGYAFLLFLALMLLICLIWSALNWLLSLACVLAVCQRSDAIASIVAAVALCRDRTGAVFAVSTWTGLGHLVAFVGATTVVSMPLGLGGVLPGRLVALGVLLVTLAYFAVSDWLYTARLAGYVCIVEMPESMIAPVPSPPPAPAAPVQTTIDRDEVILSDMPGLAVET